MTVMAWLRAHQRALYFLCLLLVIGGAVSAFRLPVALFPDVQFPRVVVSFEADLAEFEKNRHGLGMVSWMVGMQLRGFPQVRSRVFGLALPTARCIWPGRW